MDIHRSSIGDFILPKLRSVFVIDYYEGIQGMLAARKEFLYKNFLSNPRLRTQTEIIWATEAFKNRPILLDELQGDEKEFYSYLLNQSIHAVESLIEVLKEEEGGMPLSELLAKSIPYINERYVYCGEGKVVVVNWGLIPRQQDDVSGSIYRSGRFIGNWDKIHMIPPIIKDITENEPVTNMPESNITELVENAGVSEHKDMIKEVISEAEIVQPVCEDTSLKEVLSVVPERTQSAKPDIQIEQQNDLPAEEDKRQSVEQETEVESNNLQVVDEEEHSSEIPIPISYNWTAFFQSLWNGLVFLLRKFIWLLLLLIFFFLVMYLCKGCQGPIHKINPFYNPLPENPVVLPVEDMDVGMSSDGLSMIAIDRLNILLERESDNTMLEWAKAFKNIYDGEEYEIVYYNKDLYKLQIQVPPSERERIKMDLPLQIKGFSFEVFDETVYWGEAVTNDPALEDPDRSWYLNPIGAYDAWEVTMGEADVVIAVVDNGFDMSHPELKGKLYHPYNVLSQNASLRPIITSEGIDAHGTHVAATAAGNCNNGGGLLGIAPNCKLMPVQVGNDNEKGAMSSTAIIEGVMYAIKQGADVVNVSLGMYLPEQVKGMSEGQQLNFISNSYKQEEFMWNKVFEAARNRNCIIVFAAGNDNMVAGIDPKKRNGNTIRVSAVNRDLIKADFSNFGVYPELNREYSTVSAPGVAIYSAAPGNQYKIMRGTSMAAPVVSGAVALLKSVDKNIDAGRVISILRETGLDVGYNIGPIIQIGNAIHALRGDTLVNDNCEKIKIEIQRLKARIDSLIRVCPDAVARADTLKYEEAIRDKHGLDGIWKTTTELVSTADRTPIELYMSFKELEGTLMIINKGEKYTAPLKAKIKKGKIDIVQYGSAKNGEKSFLPYKYVCTADRKRNLFCTATSTENRITFNLVRIK